MWVRQGTSLSLGTSACFRNVEYSVVSERASQGKGKGKGKGNRGDDRSTHTPEPFGSSSLACPAQALVSKYKTSTCPITFVGYAVRNRRHCISRTCARTCCRALMRPHCRLTLESLQNGRALHALGTSMMKAPGAAQIRYFCAAVFQGSPTFLGKAITPIDSGEALSSTSVITRTIRSIHDDVTE